MSRLRVRMVLLGLGLGLGVAACEWNDVLNPRFGYEYEDIKCRNHVDDDYDGLIDCEDPDCIFTSSLCGEYVPVGRPGQEREDTFVECIDSVDNDYNGQFDCGDPKCQAIAEVCCFKEFSNARCSDGVDNDQNGFADCGDFQCRNGMFVQICGSRPPVCLSDVDCDVGVENTAERCTDELDNDGNGFADCDDNGCENIPGCQTSAECQVGDPCFGSEDTLERCQDGLDNDDNTFVDCDDFSCSMSSDSAILAYCANQTESSSAQCTDGLDNDDNGFVDCDDNGCKTTSHCSAILENSLAECSDGVDNDGNTYVDCQDRSCSSIEPMDSVDPGVADKTAEIAAIEAHCDSVLERGPVECSDGIDNDTNGFVDCADFSCKNDDDAAVQAVCQESLGTMAEADAHCGDGADNDGDGFVDCADWDCNWNPLVTVCPLAGQSRVCE